MFHLFFVQWQANGDGYEWRLDKVTIFAVFTAVLEFFHQVARAVE
jgi:seryl-tRNA(Sec) selenium transferase